MDWEGRGCTTTTQSSYSKIYYVDKNCIPKNQWTLIRSDKEIGSPNISLEKDQATVMNQELLRATYRLNFIEYEHHHSWHWWELSYCCQIVESLLHQMTFADAQQGYQKRECAYMISSGREIPRMLFSNVSFPKGLCWGISSYLGQIFTDRNRFNNRITGRSHCWIQKL